MPLLAHRSIGRTLCKLRDSITNDERVSPKAAKALLCCGIAMYRRYTIGEHGEEDGDDREETTALVKKSSVLIFVLLAAIESRRGDDVDVEVTRKVVDRANRRGLAGVLEIRKRRSRRKSNDTDTHSEKSATPQAPEAPEVPVASEVSEATAESEAPDTPDTPDVPVTSGELTMSVLQYVSSTLADNASLEHERLAELFFRTSASCMAQNLLLAHGTSDFVSLNVKVDHPVPRDQRLLGIAQAGESEAGQSCLRDILLSFLLPSGIIGVRRNLLLSRAASTAAGIDHADAVNQAHSVAMAGCEYIWVNGTDPLERACALLAGAAVLTTKGVSDPIRKCDAFLGRVSLPFFETTPPASGVKRLTLLADQKRWVLYKVDKKNAPHVLCNLRGFEGLCDCLLEFL